MRVLLVSRRPCCHPPSQSTVTPLADGCATWPHHEPAPCQSLAAPYARATANSITNQASSADVQDTRRNSIEPNQLAIGSSRGRNVLLGAALCAAAALTVGMKTHALPPERPSTSFARLLVSTAPSTELPPAAIAVFEPLIGDWDVAVTDIESDGSRAESTGEWHFAWVLEGRAVQDVWIAPRLPDRARSTNRTHNRYGTSIRFFDADLGAWRVIWINPVTHDRSDLVARCVNGSIVQQGVDSSGTYFRWTFSDITASSFTWRAEFSDDAGRSWTLDAEFRAKRSVLHRS